VRGSQPPLKAGLKKLSDARRVVVRPQTDQAGRRETPGPALWSPAFPSSPRVQLGAVPSECVSIIGLQPQVIHDAHHRSAVTSDTRVRAAGRCSQRGRRETRSCLGVYRLPFPPAGSPSWAEWVLPSRVIHSVPVDKPVRAAGELAAASKGLLTPRTPVDLPRAMP
jgi:hypothetical protein